MESKINKGQTEEIQLRHLGSYLITKKDWYMVDQMEVKLHFTPGQNNDWVTIEYLQDMELQPRDNEPSDLKPGKWTQ